MPVSQAAGEEGLISIGACIYQGKTNQLHRPAGFTAGEMKWQRG